MTKRSDLGVGEASRDGQRHIAFGFCQLPVLGRRERKKREIGLVRTHHRQREITGNGKAVGASSHVRDLAIAVRAKVLRGMEEIFVGYVRR